MGYDPATGLWIGYCPHASWIDVHSCCITLNIVPTCYSVFFLCLVIGCPSCCWGAFYMVTASAMWGWLLWVANIDGEPCLAIGLGVEAVGLCLVSCAMVRRLCICLHDRRHSSGMETELEPTPIFGDDLVGAIAGIQNALTPRGLAGSTPRGDGSTPRSRTPRAQVIPGQEPQPRERGWTPRSVPGTARSYEQGHGGRFRAHVPHLWAGGQGPEAACGPDAARGPHLGHASTGPRQCTDWRHGQYMHAPPGAAHGQYVGGRPSA